MPREKAAVSALPVKRVADIKRPRSWAIYGRSGSGKTTLAGSFPGPLLLLDFRDQGTDSVADVKNLDVMEMEDWESVEDVYLHLLKNPKKYKTVIFDTITQMQGLAMEEVVAKKKKKVTGNLGDWGTLSQKEWGEIAALMKEEITRFRDLPLEIVFLAQERVNKVNDTNDDEELLVPEVGPALSPSIASHLNACVSIIGNTFIRVRRRVIKREGKKPEEKEDMRYCLRIGAHPVYTTKVRKAKIIEVPGFIEDPTYDDVLDVLAGE